MNANVELSWKQATDVSGRKVLVTGIASGIGRATAKAFAAAGATVYGGDVNEAGANESVAAIRAAGGQAEFVPLDLTKPASIDAFVDAVLAKSGRAIDVIASVAGWDKIEPFLKNDPGTWDRIIAINYVGPVRMIQRLLPALIERGQGGKVVTVASDAGRVGSTGETFYSGSKGALIAFTKGLAREMARHRITCNVIAPGPTDTPLFTEAMEDKLRESLIKAIPLRRTASPAEIANAIIFFSSPATDYVTGQVLSVSGGLTMHG